MIVDAAYQTQLVEEKRTDTGAGTVKGRVPSSVKQRWVRETGLSGQYRSNASEHHQLVKINESPVDLLNGQEVLDRFSGHVLTSYRLETV